jgi:hypothetical protein
MFDSFGRIHQCQRLCSGIKDRQKPWRGRTVGHKDLGGEAAHRSEHGPAAVHELDLAVASEGLRVCGETGGVPAVVTWELSLQV